MTEQKDVRMAIELLRKKLSDEWPKNPFAIFIDLERGAPLSDYRISRFARDAEDDQIPDTQPKREVDRIVLGKAINRSHKYRLSEEEWEAEIRNHDPGGYWDSNLALDTVYWFCRALKPIMDQYPDQRDRAERVIDKAIRYIKYSIPTVREIGTVGVSSVAKSLLTVAMFPSRFDRDKVTAALSHVKDEATIAPYGPATWVVAESLMSLIACGYSAKETGRLTGFLLEMQREDGRFKVSPDSAQAAEDDLLVLPDVLLALLMVSPRDRVLGEHLRRGFGALVEHMNEIEEINVTIMDDDLYRMHMDEWGSFGRAVWRGRCLMALYSYLGEIQPTLSTPSLRKQETDVEEVRQLAAKIAEKQDKHHEELMEFLKSNRAEVISKLEVILGMIGNRKEAGRIRKVLGKLHNGIATGADIVVLSEVLTVLATTVSQPAVQQQIIELIKLLAR